MKSKYTKALLIAIERGYKIDENGIVYNPKGKVVKGCVNKRGYYNSGFRVNYERFKYYFHRLQGYQKYGDLIFKEENLIRHLDGNPANNSYDNIAIGSHTDNMHDIPRDKMRTYDHEKIINDKNNGMSYKEIMKKHNIKSKGTVSFIINKSMEIKK